MGIVSYLNLSYTGKLTYVITPSVEIKIFQKLTVLKIFQIKYLQPRDSGMYECQVSTQPVRSFFVRLNILGKISSTSQRFYFILVKWAIFFKSMKFSKGRPDHGRG